MQIIVDQLAVNYELKGKGKLVLLLHGWGDDYNTFSHLINSLSLSYKVVALDLPGFGGTQMPSQTWNLDNYSNFVSSFLTKLKLGNPYAIIGHSNGGAVAIRALSLNQLKTEKLVLLASAGIRNKKSLRQNLIKIVAKVGKLTTFWLPLELKQKLRLKLYGTIGSDLLVVPHLQETFKQTVKQDIQAEASKLSVETLLIFADKDKAIPLSDGQLFSKLIKNSRLEIIRSSDHFIHHDKADQVERLIMEFI